MGDAGAPFIGSRISLISNSDIRYEGTLIAINMEESSIDLEQVRSFGSENRRANSYVPPTTQIYGRIVFKGDDIKDLTVLNQMGPPAPQHQDPAIISVMDAPPTRPYYQPEPVYQQPQAQVQAPASVPAQTAAPLYESRPWGDPPSKVTAPPPQAAPAAAPAAPTPQAQTPTATAPQRNAGVATNGATAAKAAVAPTYSLTPGQQALRPAAPKPESAPAPPAPPSTWAQAAGAKASAGPGRGAGFQGRGPPNPSYGSGSGRGAGRGGPVPGPATAAASAAVMAASRPGVPAGPPGQPRPAPATAGAAAAAPVFKEDYDFQASNAKFNKDELAKEAVAEPKDTVYKKDDFFDLLSTDTSMPNPDWRQKMMEQKKIDMETFGGLEGVRHTSFGRGGRGPSRGGLGAPGGGRGYSGAAGGGGYGNGTSSYGSGRGYQSNRGGYGTGVPGGAGRGSSFMGGRGGGRGGRGVN